MALTVEHLHDLLEPGAAALGFEVVAVQILGRERPTLRVYINNPVKRKALAAACKMWGADNILRSQGQMNYVRLVQDRPVSTSKKTIYFKRIQQICNGVENTLLKAPWEYDKP